MGPAVALMYFQEFALACVVTGRTGREGFEELLGERVPDRLWSELEELGESNEKLSLSNVEEVSAALATAALSCVSRLDGGRPRLDERLDRATTDEE